MTIEKSFYLIFLEIISKNYLKLNYPLKDSFSLFEMKQRGTPYTALFAKFDPPAQGSL